MRFASTLMADPNDLIMHLQAAGSSRIQLLEHQVTTLTEKLDANQKMLQVQCIVHGDLDILLDACLLIFKHSNPKPCRRTSMLAPCYQSCSHDMLPVTSRHAMINSFDFFPFPGILHRYQSGCIMCTLSGMLRDAGHSPLGD